MKKTKILHVGMSHNPGGIEVYCLNLARNIDAKKFSLDFLNADQLGIAFDRELKQNRARVLNITPRNHSLLKHILDLRSLFKNCEYDIIEFHMMSYRWFEPILAARIFSNAKLVLHAHTHPSTAKSQNIVHVLSSLLGRVSTTNRRGLSRLACSQTAGEAFFDHKDFNVIHNAIPLDNFLYKGQDRQQIRKELHIPMHYKVVLHVGRFNIQKNHSFLLDIFKEYAIINPSSTLLLVGDGELRSAIEKKVAKLDLAQKVLFLGSRSDVGKLYSAADLALFPSLREGIPLTLIEAQANGLPCIVSDTVDPAVKLTRCIQFRSLSLSANAWAQAIKKVKIKRFSTLSALQNSSYSIAESIHSTERYYHDILKHDEKAPN